MTISLTKPRFMLCEGEDDKKVFGALIRERALPEFQIFHAAELGGVGGRSGFVSAMRSIHALSGFDSLRGMLLVSDNDVMNDSFAEVQRALTENGYDAPPTPGDVGRVKDKPLSVLMIPSGDTEGDLETLCLPALHEKWPNSAKCVDDFLRCSDAISWRKRSSLSKARARAAALGFHENDPYQGIGILFERSVLSAHHTCFDAIVTYLQDFDTICHI